LETGSYDPVENVAFSEDAGETVAVQDDDGSHLVLVHHAYSVFDGRGNGGGEDSAPFIPQKGGNGRVHRVWVESTAEIPPTAAGRNLSFWGIPAFSGRMCPSAERFFAM
jgi:hypothetical protein